VNGLDYAIVGVIAASALLSLIRGFVREVLSLVAWILAFWAALSFNQVVAASLAGALSNAPARQVVAYFGIFLATLLAVGLVNRLITGLLERVGLAGTDRVLGMVFGAARGVVVVSALLFVLGLTPLREEPWWRQALLVDYFQFLSVWVVEQMPGEWRQVLP